MLPGVLNNLKNWIKKTSLRLGFKTKSCYRHVFSNNFSSKIFCYKKLRSIPIILLHCTFAFKMSLPNKYIALRSIGIKPRNTSKMSKLVKTPLIKNSQISTICCMSTLILISRIKS